MISDENEVAWAQKYRPKTVEDTILPKKTKEIFQSYVDENSIPQNLILSGGAGVGKTTVAKAMLDEMGCDYLVINGSLNGNIDTLRHDISNFASTVSFMGGRKYVILDEADYLNPNSTQPALRNFMEEFSKNCGFVLTCNFRNRIIDPLQSRCSVVEFAVPKEEKKSLLMQFFTRVTEILKENSIEFDQKVVAEYISLHYPDWRKTLNGLQFYSKSGKIDSGILANKNVDNINALLDYMKDKNFSEVRKWVAENSDIESSVFYTILYKVLPEKLSSAANLAECIVTLATYQYQEGFVANVEINRAAALAILMTEADWK